MRAAYSCITPVCTWTCACVETMCQSPHVPHARAYKLSLRETRDAHLARVSRVTVRRVRGMRHARPRYVTMRRCDDGSTDVCKNVEDERRVTDSRTQPNLNLRTAASNPERIAAANPPRRTRIAHGTSPSAMVRKTQHGLRRGLRLSDMHNERTARLEKHGDNCNHADPVQQQRLSV